MKRLERLIERLTVRLVTCPIDDFDKVKAELSAAQKRYEALKAKADRG